MSSKREEERNEKIIRGLMKLPPNRRCINCNSLGPQYVCTNFWTFVCTTCSGIHREFTHRVKSVSMAKFTFQEVDALQKGGNQRARELFLKAWDPQRNRLPDNSNVDKVREFIKNVYVDKKYSLQKSSDKPPRDPQSLRSHEDETRRASSYHSYSQSPPYDFQYEERRYGKHGRTLTRPGSDRGFYEGKLASFLSPTHLNDEKFANEGSYPRISDYSVSGGGDPFRSDVLSPSSWKENGSPFSDTSRDISGEVPQVDSIQRNSDENSRSNGGRIRHPQRTGSSGSFGSFDSSSMSFRSVNSLGLPEVGSEPAQSAEISHEKSSSFQSLPQSSGSVTFDGLDLFSAPFAPQNSTVTSPTDSNSQLPQSSLAESLNVVQQSPISSVPLFTEQQSSEIPERLPLDLFVALSQQQSAVSSHGKKPHGKASDGVMPNSGGWATFDMPSNVVPVATENSSAAVVPSSDGNNLGNLNPFSIDQNSSYEGPTGHEPPSSIHTFGHENPQNIEATINNTHFWNAFDDSAGGQPTQDVLKINGQTAVHCTSDADKSLGFGVYEASNNDGTVRTADVGEPPSSSLSSDFSMALNDFPMVAAVAGTHPFAIDSKPTNPFDLPYDPDLESSNMSQFWKMSSLQAALPSTQMPTSYVGVAEESWFPQNSVSSYVPGGVPFDPTSGPLGFIAGQAASAPVQTIHTQGPVASVGGNPFA